ncbi:DNA polymerase III subunit beta [Canibacter zhoujuaniae]|uniref:DNA polymerase III subunit beta n=1 Tax=Canibacter zhoujuaniae TaxID=2708343 RepID=UPI00142218DC|nr:DNA polymerase III subunit beta [Canibacter zhoujuaniae]
MRFSMNREVFAEAVGFPVAMLPARAAQPILGGILLEAHDGNVTFSIFNFEVSAKTTVQAEINESGRVLVAGRLLATIANKLPGDTVELELVANQLQISSGAASFNLPAMPVEEYPAIPDLTEITGEVRGSDFVTAVNQVFPAASSEDVTPVITGVHLKTKENVLTLTATDRYRVAMRGIDWENHDAETEHEALVPAKVIHEVSKLLAKAETIKIVIQKNGDRQLIGFIGDGRSITSTLISGNYPPVERLFPETVENFAVINTGDLRQAVDLVSIVVEQHAAVRFNFVDGQVTLEGTGGEAGRATQSVDTHLVGDDVVISLRPSFLRDGLNGANSEFTRIAFTATSVPGKPGPVLISGQRSKDSADDTSFRYLLQPNLLQR